MTKPLFKADILTLFPEIYPGPLAHSVTGRGLDQGIIAINAINIRNYANDKHKTVDDIVYGGGDGMLLKPDVLGKAIEDVHKSGDVKNDVKGNERNRDFSKKTLIIFSPRGKPLTQNLVKKYSKSKAVTLICPRYEGVDDRLISYYDIEEVSIGDYVLSNGDLAALIFLDALMRLIPGVVGKTASVENESFEEGKLEYPHYTRPQMWNGLSVPKVLLSGNHKEIANWRKEQSEKVTKTRRPDLTENIKK